MFQCFEMFQGQTGSGNLTRTFFHDPNKPIGTMLAHVDGTAPSTTDFLYYFQDNIGSTTQLRNEDNTFAGDYEYTPYGQSWQGGGATTDHQFTGKYHDTKADLYYFPYRHYNPSLARWTTPDPLGMVDGPNLYSYVKSSPVGSFDSLGLISGWQAWFCSVACGLAGIGYCVVVPGLGLACGVILLLLCATICSLRPGPPNCYQSAYNRCMRDSTSCRSSRGRKIPGCCSKKARDQCKPRRDDCDWAYA